MSWIDKNEDNQFTITMGDGKTFGNGSGASSNYRLLWKNASKTVEFNTATFNFPNLSGSLVKRSEPMGRTFTFELYFVGGGHVEAANEFEISANDKRPWEVHHPYYGYLIVQPISISFDNSEYNVTKFTIPVMETIVDELPKTKIDPVDSIVLAAKDLQYILPEVVLAPIKPVDVNQIKSTVNKSYNLSLPLIKLPKEFEDFYNAFNQANSFVSTAIATPLQAIRATTQLLSYPSKFTTSVKERVNVLQAAFTGLRATLNNSMGVAGKQIYQVNGAAYLLGMCASAATPLNGDYTNKLNVLEINNSIFNSYNQYLEDLDNLQTPNGSDPLSFIPSANSLQQLSQLVYLTISSLYGIALNSRTERFIITQTDTNVIMLTHALYSLDKDDNNINELIENNGWGLKHLLQIDKGTKVIYYI